MLPSVPWRVEVLDHRVVKELDALAPDVRQHIGQMVELIESYGMAAMHEPRFKHLEGKLWEMRPRGRDGIARVLYVVATGERAVMVHAFVKKTQKTPRNALEVARKRAREVL